ncbi:lamin tail domain-containing protein [Planctomycetota bacterium]
MKSGYTLLILVLLGGYFNLLHVSSIVYAQDTGPVITEFLAKNGSSMPLGTGEILDEDGDSSDWIELYNPSPEPLDLAGWYLTDDPLDLTQWRFPEIQLPAHQFLIVYASGKDRKDPQGWLHANFKLSGVQGFLALVQPDGQTAATTYDYPDQFQDISYGASMSGGAQGYLSPPTPGQVNGASAVGFADAVAFSVERGFFDTAFSLILTTSVEDADIRYTLNGSTPTSTTGVLYTGPLQVDHTTVVRAAAFKPGYMDAPVGTHTYLFTSDVIRQSPQGEAPNVDWPNSNINGQMIDYGMDPEVVDDPRWAHQIEDALLDIPTMSLVTDLENLFDPDQGIYVNANNDGLAWERPTSVELIHPDGQQGFGVDAGLRIRGAFSRTGDNPKHSLRLFFRSDYGTAKLEYPLFGGEGTDTFDKIDLRTSQNNSWAFRGSSKNTLIRDVFSRDVQRDMHQPYTRSRYYHVYLNGQYWGLYQTQERADADFAESYLGGDASHYDVIKNDSSDSRALHATDGTMEAYRALYDAAVSGFASDEAYLTVQGLASNRTPDPSGQRLLHPENLMDYMICTYYTGDPDAPVSCWAHFSNNIFAIYNRVDSQGFTWYRHDAEHSLGANGGVNEARLLTDSKDRSIGQHWQHFNPAWLHVQLCEHPEYRLQFADRVLAYLTHGGLLTPAFNEARWMDRADQIDLAIIAESARWGDAKRHSPRTKDDWQRQNSYMFQSYFPYRTQIVIDKMRSVSMFPETAYVTFNQHGGEVTPGFKVSMVQEDGLPGTIYYTLNGTDPRQWGGQISADAVVYEPETSTVTLPKTTTVKARVSMGVQWGALTEARFTVGLEGLVINEIMANNTQTLEDPEEPGEFPDWIELYHAGAHAINLGGMYLTDDLQNLTKWQIPAQVTISAGQYLVFFADDNGTQGNHHTNFKLRDTGESLALIDTDGKTVLDSATFDEQSADVSYGRPPDDPESWAFLAFATPYAANASEDP